MSPLEKNSCIALSKPVAYSETFIKAHIEGLQANVIYTSSFPHHDAAVRFGNRTRQMAKAAYSLVENSVRTVQANRFFARHKPDVLLAEYGYVGADVMPYCKKKGIPLAVHFHGYDAYEKEVLEQYGKKYQALFDYAGAIIVVSEDMRQQLIGLGALADKVICNVYGVDVNRFQKSDVLRSQKQLIAVGRFVEKKAPYLTLLAFENVLENVPDATLVMVGDGPLLDVCRQLIGALGLSKSVRLCGAVPHAEVAELLQTSRAFVQHSIRPASGDSEGTPNTILEAQACALPVISTLHAGIKEAVVQNETGYLVAEGDIKGMAEHMVSLLQDPEKAARMGHAGREHIRNHYKMEDSISRLKQIVYNCIG